MTRLLTVLLLSLFALTACTSKDKEISDLKAQVAKLEATKAKPNLAADLTKILAPKGSECFPLFDGSGYDQTYSARCVLADESQIIVVYSLKKPLELEVKGFLPGRAAPNANDKQTNNAPASAPPGATVTSNDQSGGVTAGTVNVGSAGSNAIDAGTGSGSGSGK